MLDVKVKTQDQRSKIKRVRYQRPKDPLLDMVTLNEIGQRASNKAKARAFANGSPITIERNGKIIKIFPDGKEKVLKKASKNPPLTLAEILC